MTLTFDKKNSIIPPKKEEGMNWEKIPRTPDGQLELRFETFGTVKEEELDINEYLCKGLIGHDNYPFVTTAYCENKAMNQGCEDIKTCPHYQQQKLFQKKHPEINWETPHNNSPEQITRIKFIKTGAIIEK